MIDLKYFCNTGKISKKMWNKFSNYLKDIYFLDKEVEIHFRTLILQKFIVKEMKTII